MARYVASIDNSYKQPIPYHFTCNYCGEVTQKSYDINVSVKAHGSAQHVGGVRREADRQHDKQVKKEVTAKKREIEKYRQKLVAGESVTDKKLWRIPLNSECAHCGKRQMWNPGTRPGIKPGHMEPIGGVGLIIAVLGGLGAFGTLAAYLMTFGQRMKLFVPAICAGILLVGIVMTRIGNAIDDHKDATWFKESFSSEPNDPDKLPVIDK